MDIKKFDIHFFNPSDNTEKTLVVNHNTETFDLEFDGSAVSIINNGDNSWSLVEGDIDQETVNTIGAAIENALNAS